MKTIKPAAKQIFAKPQAVETTTASGIILTVDKDKKYEPKLADIINVGSDVTSYSPKQTILYKEYAATEIKLNDEDYVMVDELDVLGVVVEV